MPDERKVSALTLPVETVAGLTTMEEDIKVARHELDVLKKLGLDVTMLEEKLDWSEKVRTTLLTEFG